MPFKDALLRTRFRALWSRTVRGGDVEAAWRALDAGYGLGARHYHGWNHIIDLLAGHDAVRDLPDFVSLDHDALDLAIFFHDAIYETDRTDNEARSADLLATHAGLAGESERLRSVEAMIRATATHTPSSDPATGLMLDLDLAVLGAPPSTYAEYKAAIRREYMAIPETAWRLGRASVLGRFLARLRLYQTDHFHDRLEASARVNIAMEMGYLENFLW